MTNEKRIKEIQAGREKKENLEQLWEQNRGLVCQIARKYAAFADQEELLQEGYLALHKAAYAYHSDKGAFSTFLYCTLSRAFSRYIGRQSLLVLPDGIRQQIGELDRLEHTLLRDCGRFPTKGEACCLLEITPEQLDKVQGFRMLARVDSLDRPVDQEVAETPLSDCIAAPGNAMATLEEEIYQKGMKTAVWAAVDSLAPQESDVIRCRYAAGQGMAEIGERYKETPEWARRTEARALRHLRQGHRYRLLLPYWEEMHSAGMKGVGARRFNETWTSATEREALRLVDRGQGQAT